MFCMTHVEHIQNIKFMQHIEYTEYVATPEIKLILTEIKNMIEYNEKEDFDELIKMTIHPLMHAYIICLAIRYNNMYVITEMVYEINDPEIAELILIEASASKNIEIVEFIIKRNSSDDLVCALESAFHYGNEIVAMLIINELMARCENNPEKLFYDTMITTICSHYAHRSILQNFIKQENVNIVDVYNLYITYVPLSYTKTAPLFMCKDVIKNTIKTETIKEIMELYGKFKIRILLNQMFIYYATKYNRDFFDQIIKNLQSHLTNQNPMQNITIEKQKRTITKFIANRPKTKLITKRVNETIKTECYRAEFIMLQYAIYYKKDLMEKCIDIVLGEKKIELTEGEIQQLLEEAIFFKAVDFIEIILERNTFVSHVQKLMLCVKFIFNSGDLFVTEFVLLYCEKHRNNKSLWAHILLMAILSKKDVYIIRYYDYVKKKDVLKEIRNSGIMLIRGQDPIKYYTEILDIINSVPKS